LYSELLIRDINAEQQKCITVQYKGNVVGEYCADIVVADKIIVELKAVEKIVDLHEIQLKNYLKATGFEVGLLINFGKSVEVKRKYVVRNNLQPYTGSVKSVEVKRKYVVRSAALNI
jgi:GxxExxY protein